MKKYRKRFAADRIRTCYLRLKEYPAQPDCWGTRQAGGGDAKTKTPVDRAMDTVKGWMGKNNEEPVSAPVVEVDADKPTYKTLEFKTKKGKEHISAVSDRIFIQKLDNSQDGGIRAILKNDEVYRRNTSVTLIIFNTSWIKSSQSPHFFQNDPAFGTLSSPETKFWSGMVDNQQGEIRNFKNDEELKRKNQELTDEMDNFRDKLFGYFFYINLVWIICCTLAQNYRLNH